jgi:hypothetical protein
VLEIVKRILVDTPLFDLLNPLRRRVELVVWERKGRPNPAPNLIDQRVVARYGQAFHMRTFVETGTYLGEMVDAVRDKFEKIFSVELDRRLYERARKRFAKCGHISIMHGDSSTVLPEILSQITQPCLFWLDAHFSAGITARGKTDTPITEELKQILSHPFAREHVILIDDARLFIGESGYPTQEDLRSLVLGALPEWVVQVEDDIICAHKRPQDL